ncbi:hypothetical protein C3L33_18958, partial [Rhododendron williamsianum]
MNATVHDLILHYCLVNLWNLPNLALSDGFIVCLLVNHIVIIVKWINAVASILNILDNELVQNVGNYIVSCQTYEGGIAGEPGSEAHGGYTFCGLAAMILIGEVNRLDLPSLIGGVSALIQRLHSIVDEPLMPLDAEDDCSTGTESSATSDVCDGEQDLEGNLSHADDTCHLRQEGEQTACDPANFFNIGLNFIRGHSKLEPLFHSVALQQYILLCSQEEGGFRDKPGKHKDYYHTCYCLSGLSVCQYSWSKKAGSPPLPGMPLTSELGSTLPLYVALLGMAGAALLEEV